MAHLSFGYTHFTFRIRPNHLERLKAIAMEETIRQNKIISMAEMIRRALDKEYPGIFADEDKVMGQKSL